MPPSLLRRVLLIATICTLPLGDALAAPAKIAPDAAGFTLDNGLEVVVIPDHRSPTVTHMVWYKAGSADDPPGTSGIAHFLEHLMFKGTKNHPAGEFSAKLSEIGGNENAFTTADYTGYHQSVAKQHLGFVMEYEADRMANLVLTDEAVLPERGVILEERRSRTDNDPAALLGEAVAAALYQNSRYGTPVIGWPHEMVTLDRADAVAFYDRYYTPNNAVVVVAGDVTVEEVRRLAEATYGKVPKRAEPPQRLRAQEPEPVAARAVTVADPRVTQPTLQRSYLAPSEGTAEDGETEALDVLGEILGGGATSRLYRTLVIEKAVATSVGAGYRGAAIDDTAFYVYAIPRGDITLEGLAREIDAVIAKLIDEGVNEAELSRAKRRMIAGAVYAQDSQSTLARIFGAGVAIGGTIAEIQDWPSRIDAVTADAVVAAARKYLDVRRSVTGYLVSAPVEIRS